MYLQSFVFFSLKDFEFSGSAVVDIRSGHGGDCPGWGGGQYLQHSGPGQEGGIMQIYGGLGCLTVVQYCGYSLSEPNRAELALFLINLPLTRIYILGISNFRSLFLGCW